ncbi:MAG: ArsR/SmtB family transcription factor [Isosphaerales bacterium]
MERHRLNACKAVAIWFSVFLTLGLVCVSPARAGNYSVTNLITDNKALNEFLGLSSQEYAHWVEEPKSLESALDKRKHGRKPSGGHQIVAEKARGIEGAQATFTRKSKVHENAAERLKQAQEAAKMLKLVSDPTRLQVILMLAEGERNVVDLCHELQRSQPAVSHHLALLRSGRIASRPRETYQSYELTERGEELVKIVKRLM